MPSSAPAAPTSAPSASSQRNKRRRDIPSVRSSANCALRRATASACVENTSRPPVNSATRASTLRFTRYARDMRAVTAALSCGVAIGDTGWQHRRQPRAQRRDVRARARAHVDAGKRAPAAEHVLRGGDVHHREALARLGPDATRDRSDVARSPVWTAMRSPRSAPSHAAVAALTNTVSGSQEVERVVGGSQERRRDERRAKRVDAVDPQRIRAADDLGIDLHHRARHRDVVGARDAREQHLVEAAARTANLEVRRARHRLHPAHEFGHRGPVDRRHREAERDAQRDREHRQREASTVAAECAADRGACDLEPSSCGGAPAITARPR